MRCGGISIAMTVQFLLLALIVGAFVILARCANQYQCATYQDIILFTLGKRWYNFSQVRLVTTFC